MSRLSSLTLVGTLSLVAVLGCQGNGSAAGASTAGTSTANAATSQAAATPGAAAAKVKNGFDGMPAVGTKAVCPVMGDEFEVKADTQSSVYKGKTYVFCCPACKPQFDANPAKYVGS
jgi:YHS domain-containing protein